MARVGDELMINIKKYKKITNSINWSNEYFLKDRKVWLYNLHKTRFISIINEIENHLKKHEQPIKILDIGFVPGTFGIILKEYFKEKIILDGAGLGLTNNFKNNTYVKNAYNSLFEIEFDPENLQNINKNIQTELSSAQHCYYDTV